MIKKLVVMLGLIVFMVGSVAQADDLTADEIIERVDDNQFVESAYLEARMIIEGRRSRENAMYVFIQDNNSFMEFTAPPQERGTKYLKRGDELRMYFPEAEEAVIISGHALQEGLAGSDFSYQDMMESEKLTELYDYEIVEKTELEGRPVYILQGLLKEGKEAAYYDRKMWIDAERFTWLKEELYARNGRLLKVSEAKELQEFEEGRWYPVETVMEDKLLKESRTIFIIDHLDFGVDIPEDTFSIDALE
ncbi:MAG TPA: outer membrane lipoprotein-sorting protein [Halanaerobiales bacterium]|nr:outer membrane lipoprotein-sorting protein [Halanaerobiales bacterium]